MTMSNTELLEKTMAQLVLEIPGASGVMHKHKLDFCCGGHKTLSEALHAKNLPSEPVIQDLQRLQATPMEPESSQQMATEALIEHILERYHDTHREQLPELVRMAQRVERVHGAHPECPRGLWAHLERMQQELEEHMRKEEEILFPMLTQPLHVAARHPIQVMRMEHNDHGLALEKLEALAHQLTLPEQACNTWRALYFGLDTLKKDLMQHIHLENNVLFPRFEA